MKKLNVRRVSEVTTVEVKDCLPLLDHVMKGRILYESGKCINSGNDKASRLTFEALLNISLEFLSIKCTL